MLTAKVEADVTNSHTSRVIEHGSSQVSNSDLIRGMFRVARAVRQWSGKASQAEPDILNVIERLLVSPLARHLVFVLSSQTLHNEPYRPYLVQWRRGPGLGHSNSGVYVWGEMSILLTCPSRLLSSAISSHINETRGAKRYHCPEVLHKSVPRRAGGPVIRSVFDR